MTTIDALPGKTLGMLADLCHKLQHGSHTLEELERFLKRQNPFDLKPAIRTSKPKAAVLKLVNDQVALMGSENFDPQAYFQTRPGLWVSEEFVSRVRSKAKPVENLGSATLKSYDLTKAAYDREIKTGLGANHVFDQSELIARLEQMVGKQQGGEEGELLNNGYANLFYLAGWVVYVRWNAGRRRWNVGVWKLDDFHWHEGDRIFSRN